MQNMQKGQSEIKRKTDNTSWLKLKARKDKTLNYTEKIDRKPETRHHYSGTISGAQECPEMYATTPRLQL